MKTSQGQKSNSEMGCPYSHLPSSYKHTDTEAADLTLKGHTPVAFLWGSCRCGISRQRQKILPQPQDSPNYPSRSGERKVGRLWICGTDIAPFQCWCPLPLRDWPNGLAMTWAAPAPLSTQSKKDSLKTTVAGELSCQQQARCPFSWCIAWQCVVGNPGSCSAGLETFPCRHCSVF